jgi:hypothetical protein
VQSIFSTPAYTYYSIHIGMYQSMTCDVRLQLEEVRCAVASCDVHAEPILVVTCDVRSVHFKACEVRPHVAHYFGNNERTNDSQLLSFGVS